MRMEAKDPPPTEGGGQGRFGLTPAPGRQRSWAWFLLPVFIDIVGGALAYWALRHDSPRLARDCLYVGITLTAAKAVTTAVMLMALYGLGASLPWDDGVVVDINDLSALEECLEEALGPDGTAASIDRDLAMACVRAHALGPAPSE